MRRIIGRKSIIKKKNWKMIRLKEKETKDEEEEEEARRMSVCGVGGRKSSSQTEKNGRLANIDESKEKQDNHF